MSRPLNTRWFPPPQREVTCLGHHFKPPFGPPFLPPPVVHSFSKTSVPQAFPPSAGPNVYRPPPTRFTFTGSGQPRTSRPPLLTRKSPSAKIPPTTMQSSIPVPPRATFIPTPANSMSSVPVPAPPVTVQSTTSQPVNAASEQPVPKQVVLPPPDLHVERPSREGYLTHVGEQV